jgi:hypothetical protein
MEIAAWTQDELGKIGAAEELHLATRRADETLRQSVTMWVVRHGEELYVRSVKGRAGPWFRGTQDRHEGRIRAGGVEKDVSFVDAEPAVYDGLDAAYQAKYRGPNAQFVPSVLTAEARASTLRLVPRSYGNRI